MLLVPQIYMVESLGPLKDVFLPGDPETALVDKSIAVAKAI